MTLAIERLTTERLILIPFTIQICKDIINKDFSELEKSGFRRGVSWPDEDVLETLPKIINNLSLVKFPTGFQSWMIIKKGTLEIIGDAGFKGLDEQQQQIDIGYGIIKEERSKGFAAEAAEALIDWAFSTQVVQQITASCMLDNSNSINLLRKLNFFEIKKDQDMIYWSLSKKKVSPKDRTNEA